MGTRTTLSKGERPPCLADICFADLQSLPLAAIVALAERCARRLRADFDLPGAQADRAGFMAALDQALWAARSFAGGNGLPPDAEGIACAALLSARASSLDMSDAPATAAGFAAFCAIGADRGDLPALVELAYLAVNAGSDRHRLAARWDHARLLVLGLGRYPDRGAPVDTRPEGPLGPLWPAELEDPD